MKKKAILVAVVLCLFALSATPLTPTWTAGSLEDALAKAKSSGKLLLLDFFQEYG